MEKEGEMLVPEGLRSALKALRVYCRANEMSDAHRQCLRQLRNNARACIHRQEYASAAFYVGRAEGVVWSTSLVERPPIDQLPFAEEPVYQDYGEVWVQFDCANCGVNLLNASRTFAKPPTHGISELVFDTFDSEHRLSKHEIYSRFLINGVTYSVATEHSVFHCRPITLCALHVTQEALGLLLSLLRVDNWKLDEEQAKKMDHEWMTNHFGNNKQPRCQSRASGSLLGTILGAHH